MASEWCQSSTHSQEKAATKSSSTILQGSTECRVKVLDQQFISGKIISLILFVWKLVDFNARL